MEFLLLGPLAVRDEYRELHIAHGFQRAVLAALLTSANQIIPVSRIADMIWDGCPPRSAVITVQNYIKRLRQALGAGDGAARIRTHPGGYSIKASQAELDLLRFCQLGGAGLAVARTRDWETASRQLSVALSLWRGYPFEDVRAMAFTDREAESLSELRADLLEARIDADLHLGRHDAVLVDARMLVAAQPLRERPYGLHMLALYRCGRQAEALGVYRQAWRNLTTEAGVEPGPALRRLQQLILDAADALADPRREVLTGC